MSLWVRRPAGTSQSCDYTCTQHSTCSWGAIHSNKMSELCKYMHLQHTRTHTHTHTHTPRCLMVAPHRFYLHAHIALQSIKETAAVIIIPVWRRKRVLSAPRHQQTDRQPAVSIHNIDSLHPLHPSTLHPLPHHSRCCAGRHDDDLGFCLQQLTEMLQRQRLAASCKGMGGFTLRRSKDGRFGGIQRSAHAWKLGKK